MAGTHRKEDEQPTYACPPGEMICVLGGGAGEGSWRLAAAWLVLVVAAGATIAAFNLRNHFRDKTNVLVRTMEELSSCRPLLHTG